MARVNVEERFFAGGIASKMASVLGVREHECIGYAVYLWRDSQEALRVNATADEVIFWCRLQDQALRDKLLIALMQSQLIRPNEDGTYRICGNEEEIDGQVKRMNRNRKGAAATKKKWAEMRATGHASGRPEAMPTDTLGHASGRPVPRTMQCNAKQSNAVQVIPPIKGGPGGLAALAPVMNLITNPRTAHLPMEKQLRLAAVQVLGVIEGAIRQSGTQEELARNHVGRIGWWILHQKYTGWEAFCREYQRNFQDGKGTTFTAQLRDYIEAMLPAAVQQEGA